MLFFQFNQGPAPVLDIFSAVSFRIVAAAVRLKVFEALEQGPATAAEVAQRTGASERGMALLLDALAAFGYVEERDGQYASTAMTAKWLLPGSGADVSPGFEYWAAILDELWGGQKLEETICRGHPATNLYQWIESQPQVSDAFQRWMVATARLVADEVLAKLKIPSGARRLLDVGGGHGIYSLALCRKYPELSAVIFDSPQALKAAQANIAAAGMDGKVSVQEGNFLQGDLGEDYDVVLLFNILHGFTPEQNLGLVRSAAAALNPGGIAAIVEQTARQAPGPASLAAVRVLEMSYFHLLDGRVYTYEDIAGRLKATGFHNMRQKKLLKAPGTGLITGML
jgi:hypothetical protein